MTTTTIITHGARAPALRELLTAINDLPGIVATEGRTGPPWIVLIRPDGLPTIETFVTIEFLTYLCHGGPGYAVDFLVDLKVYSPPPYLNGPAESMYFALEGVRGDPDDFAAFVLDWGQHYIARADWDAADAA